MPSTVEQLHRDLSGRGLSVVAVNIQEPQSTAATWAREKKVTIPILLDADGEVTRQYGVIATPTSFLIDRQGRLLWPHGRAARLGFASRQGIAREPAVAVGITTPAPGFRLTQQRDRSRRAS